MKIVFWFGGRFERRAAFCTLVTASFRPRAGENRPVAQEGRGGPVRRNSVKMALPGADRVPVFDGLGASFLDFEQRVRLWMRPARTEPASRASFSVLRADSDPR